MDKTERCRNELDYALAATPIGSVWKHKKGGVYVVLGHAICTDADPTHARVRYARIEGPDYDPLREHGIEFVRLINEWTVERFERIF